MAAIVDTKALLQVVWVSLVAGIAVTAVYSLALFGTARSAEFRRRGAGGASAAFGALGVVAGIVFVAGVVIAVKLLIHRS